MRKQPKQEPMATVAEIAAAVGVGTNTVRHHCKYGHLPGAMKIAPTLWLVPARYADPARYRAAVGQAGQQPGKPANRLRRKPDDTAT
jgi:hypothetical protein